MGLNNIASKTMTTLNEIGHLVVCLRRLKRFEEAVEMQNRLIEARKAIIGQANETTLGNLSYLAEIYEEITDWPKAIEARRELYLARRNMDHCSNLKNCRTTREARKIGTSNRSPQRQGGRVTPDRRCGQSKCLDSTPLFSDISIFSLTSCSEVG